MKWIAIFLLCGITLQQCATGCLMCNSADQCTLCDITNNYFLSANACSLSIRSNCNLIGQDGTCVVCNTGYFLDSNSGGCVQVATENNSSNCSMYNANQVCVACNGNFLLSSAACVAVTTVIENCQTYAVDGSCSMCLSGYIPSNNFMACVQTATNDSCMAYTYLNCPMCASGYFPNRNLIYTLWDASMLSTMTLRGLVIPEMHWNKLRHCQAVTVTKCKVLSAFDTCTECEVGYFVDSGKCTIFPNDIIPNCINYSALTTCTGCSAGFHLTSNTCTVNISVENCATYSGTASTTTCTQCNPTHFLSGTSCVTRNISANIDNCASTTVTADTCDKCTNNFTTTSDKLKCLSVISNCDTYSPSNQSAIVLQCSHCKAGYYLVTSGSITSCSLGTVANCEIYNVSDNTCFKCKNNYHFSGSNCIRHATIANCNIYDQTKAGFCSSCNSGYYNFDLQFVCNSATFISNCATYDANGACTTCNTGYYKPSTACVLIPSSHPNCIAFDGNNCSRCATGYMINSIGTNGCISPLDYIISNANNPCATNRTITASQFFSWIAVETAEAVHLNCATCSDYRFAVEINHYEAICVLTSQLTFYQSYTAVSNCKRYGINYDPATPRIVCMECVSGHYITGYETNLQHSTGLTCASSCAITSTIADSHTVVPDDFFGFVNICVGVNADAALNFQFDGKCQRVGFQIASKIKFGFFGGAVNANDNAGAGYFCYRAGPSSTSSTTAPPSEYLLFNSLTVSGAAPSTGDTIPVYAYSQAAPTAVTATHFSTGYTFNDTGFYPTVFNYNGISTTVAISTLEGVEKAVAGVTLDNCYIYHAYRRESNAEVSPLGPEFRFANPAGVVEQYQRISSDATILGTDDNHFLTCLRCNPGYAVTFPAHNGAATNPALPSCAQIQDCSRSSVFYGGLPTFWNSIFSCHVCDQSSTGRRYPSVYILNNGIAQTAGGFVSWGILGVYRNNLLSTLNGFKCMEAPNKVYTAAGVANTAASFTALSNCGAYAYYRTLTVTATIAGADATVPAAAVSSITGSVFEATPACVACGANYFPTYFADGVNLIANAAPYPSTWMVTGCTASVNCDTSRTTQFNSCGACIADTATTYYAFMDVTAANCYKSTSPNCFMLSSAGFNNANSNTCLVCKAGYISNSENICVKIEVPNQSATGSFAKSYFAESQKGVITVQATVVADALAEIKIQYMLNYYMTPYGVSACNNGYTLATASPLEKNVCALTSYIIDPPATYGANYKANCIRYDVSTNTYVCRKCTEGFIPKDNGSECVAALANCIRAQNATPSSCEICSDNYLNVNGACIMPGIGHCATYTNTATANAAVNVMTCSTCVAGYYLMTSGIECRFGSIRNCKTYTNGSSTDCTACDDNHVLLSLSSVKYCYPIPDTYKCATFNAAVPGSNTGTGLLNCATCANTITAAFKRSSHTNSATDPNSVCLAFTPVAECETYDESDADIYDNTFACTKCRSGFYYNASQKQCVARTVTLTQCASYTSNADTCATCNAGYYLSSGTSCEAFPNGIHQCDIYSSATNCTQCKSGFYLSENACLASSTPTITNCAIYSANNVCSSCNSGYLLSNPTTCTTATATRCLTVESLTKCATCAAGEGLETSNDVTSCVTINIANCVTTTTVAPFKCLVCQDQYYPDANGVCQSVSNVIPDCVIYNSATSCNKCAQGSVLSVDQLSCIQTKYDSYLDANCEMTVLSETPICSQCSFGSYFVNGTCTACSANSFASGCLNCDPLNTNRCLLCRPSFYMNSSGACVAISVVTPPVTPNNTNSTSGVSILVKAFVLFLSALLI